MTEVGPPPVPPPPRVAVAMDDGDGRKKLRRRMFQVSATMITLVATAWICSLGPIPAILALAVAKHVLVAILMMGLGVDAPRGES